SFKKRGVVPSATYMRTYKKSDIVDISIIVNKQAKGKILVKRINVRKEHIRHSNSKDSFLKQVKENDHKAKEAEERTLKFS
ncbi:60S ribosomal protein L21-like protein, partial [Cricetulus griseus]